MAVQQINILVDDNGHVTIDVKEGFVGTECMEATAPLIKALGGKVDKTTVKPEFYEQRQTNREGQR